MEFSVILDHGADFARVRESIDNLGDLSIRFELPQRDENSKRPAIIDIIAFEETVLDLVEQIEGVNAIIESQPEIRTTKTTCDVDQFGDLVNDYFTDAQDTFGGKMSEIKNKGGGVVLVVLDVFPKDWEAPERLKQREGQLIAKKENLEDPSDGNDSQHGSQVSLVATGKNISPVTGCSLLVLSADLSLTRTISEIENLFELNVPIVVNISMKFTWRTTSARKNADRLWSEMVADAPKGFVTVVSAGNDNTNYISPVTWPQFDYRVSQVKTGEGEYRESTRVLVGAVYNTKTDLTERKLEHFSNYGSFVNIYAHDRRCNFKDGIPVGTSFSAPNYSSLVVAGFSTFPDKSGDEIIQMIDDASLKDVIKPTSSNQIANNNKLAIFPSDFEEGGLVRNIIEEKDGLFVRIKNWYKSLSTVQQALWSALFALILLFLLFLIDLYFTRRYRLKKREKTEEEKEEERLEEEKRKRIKMRKDFREMYTLLDAFESIKNEDKQRLKEKLEKFDQKLVEIGKNKSESEERRFERTKYELRTFMTKAERGLLEGEKDLLSKADYKTLYNFFYKKAEKGAKKAEKEKIQLELKKRKAARAARKLRIQN